MREIRPDRRERSLPRIERAVGLAVPGTIGLIQIMREKEQGDHRANSQRDPFNEG